MIKLNKQAEPQILRDKGAEWLKILEDKIHNGEVPTEAEKTRYRHPEIKTVLKLETHGKCAYCESRLLHIAFGDVEHISPKSLRIADTFRWANLTLACDVCNTYKKDAANLIDPYVDNPDDYLSFVGPMVYADPGQGKGVITAKQLRLNRIELIQERTKRLDEITSILLTIKSTADADVRAVIIQDLMTNEIDDSSEYAAFVRSFIATVRPDLFEDSGDASDSDT